MKIKPLIYLDSSLTKALVFSNGDSFEANALFDLTLDLLSPEEHCGFLGSY
ncbi:MAG: hypothetical protein O3C43_03360 [Verrucomicrobia bacterium]|nr:hypothetical protein [Verrucomicrobiota bacterium]MDA1065522.1 hypothetical protein [Verrucomicrobiota bacterium]